MASSKRSTKNARLLTTDTVMEEQSLSKADLQPVRSSKSNRRASIYQIAPAEFNVCAGVGKKRIYHSSGPIKSSKLTPMTYGESQRQVQLEFTPNNSNISSTRMYLKIVTESLLYLMNMDDDSQCDDYVNAIGGIFRVDSAPQSSSPIPIHKMGPRVLGGGLLDMNSANNTLLGLRHQRFPRTTTTTTYSPFSVSPSSTASTADFASLDQGDSISKCTSTTKDKHSKAGSRNRNKPEIESNPANASDSAPSNNNKSVGKRGTKPTETVHITKRFNVRSSNVFTFEDNPRRNKSNATTLSFSKVPGRNSKKTNPRSNKKPTQANNTTVGCNGNLIPQPSFKVNATLEQCLKALSGDDNCKYKDEWFDGLGKPVYFAKKPKITDSPTLYQYTPDEQKRYIEELHYDMDEQDLAFLICLNTRRVVQWCREGQAFFSDPITEQKFLEVIQGLDPSSWNFFVENLLLPGIMSERLPQNCNTDVTSLLVNGITFEVIIDSLERVAKYESRTLLGEPVNPKIHQQLSYCEICNDDECAIGNVIVYCDVCNMGVHQECYGIPYIPDDAWICQRCNASPSNAIKCCLCPSEQGVMKQTDRQQWCHMVCALWIGDVTFANTVFLEPIDTSALSTDRFKLNCTLCNIKCGACIQCMHNSCYVAMHVSCAQAAGLLVFQITKRLDHNGTVTEIQPKFKCYCPFHVTRAMNGHSESYTVMDDKKNIETRYIISKQNTNNLISSCNGSDSLSDDRTTLGNNKRTPVVQISCIDETKLEELSLQLPLFKSKQLVHDVYQYWLIKRFVRCGSPLVRGLTALIASANVTSTSTASNTTESDSANTKSNKNLDTDNDCQKAKSKYEKDCADFKIVKTQHNHLNVVQFLICFETVVLAIVKMFIDLATGIDSDDDATEAHREIAIRVHNVRAFMIRNLATLDPKCPSYLKNIVYPLDLFDQLHNFSLNYLDKLFDLSPQHTNQHAATKNSYHKLFMAIRNIVKRRFPVGRFKFHFIDTFKQQLQNKNYTMSHDAVEESVARENVGNEAKLTSIVENCRSASALLAKHGDNEFTGIIDVKSIPGNNAQSSSSNTNNNNNVVYASTNNVLGAVTRPARKSRKGIPGKSPTSCAALTRGLIVKSVFNSTGDASMNKYTTTVVTPTNNSSATTTDETVRLESINADSNEDGSSLIEAGSGRLSKSSQSPTNTYDNEQKAGGRFMRVTRRNKSFTDDIAAIVVNGSDNKAVKPKSQEKPEKSILSPDSFDNQTTAKNTLPKKQINSDNYRLTRSKNSLSNQLSSASSSLNKPENDVSSMKRQFKSLTVQSKLSAAATALKKRTRSSLAASDPTESSSRPQKSAKLSKSGDAFEIKSLNITSKKLHRLTTLRVLPIFNMVNQTGKYYSTNPPYNLLKDPRTDPSSLEQYTLVWAKMPGYSAYPGIVIDVDSKLNQLRKYHITIQGLKQIQTFIKNTYDGNLSNVNKNKNPADILYIVVFFDNSRTFQVLPRKHLQPLGVDREVDNHFLYNYYSNKKIRSFNTFNDGYKFALASLNTSPATKHGVLK